MSIFRRKKVEPRPPKGDPEGVAKAQALRAEAERTLHRDRREVIEPLRRELYKNNIQEMIEELLGGSNTGKGSNGGTSTNPTGC